MGKSKFSVIRLKSMPYENECNQRVLSIMDTRFPYKSKRNPFQKNEYGEYLLDENGNRIFLSPLLNYQLHIKDDWEKQFDRVIGLDEDGKELRIKDYWRIAQIDDIHPSFLEQLTMQISPIIFQKLGKSLPNKSYHLDIWDDAVIEEKGTSYLSIHLVNPRRSDPLWVKWISLNAKKTYVKMNEPVDSSIIQFDLCSFEEEIYCSTIRHEGKNDIGIGTIEKLKESLDSTPKLPKLRFRYSISCRSYPDVIFQLYIREKTTSELKLHIEYIFRQFIQQWNEKQPRNEYIHDAFIYDDKANKAKNLISIVVDFANTNSTAVLDLLHYLHNCDLEIEKIIVS